MPLSMFSISDTASVADSLLGARAFVALLEALGHVVEILLFLIADFLGRAADLSGHGPQFVQLED
jgi:hypothetical protein